MDQSKMYAIELNVRDYECDLQGIVNNAVYLNYLEHARHMFLKTIGFDFARMHRECIDALAIRIEIDYRYPLTSGDHFMVTVQIQRERKLKLLFNQTILRLPDKKPIVAARVYAICMKEGKPVVPFDILEAIRKRYPDFK